MYAVLHSLSPELRGPVRRLLFWALMLCSYVCLGDYTQSQCDRLVDGNAEGYVQFGEHIFRTDLGERHVQVGQYILRSDLLERLLVERLDIVPLLDGHYVSNVFIYSFKEENVFWRLLNVDFELRGVLLYRVVPYGSWQPGYHFHCSGTFEGAGLGFGCRITHRGDTIHEGMEMSVDGDLIGLRRCTARRPGDPDLGIHGH